MIVRDPKTGLFKKVSKVTGNLKPVKKGGRPKGKKDSRPRNLKHKRFTKRAGALGDSGEPLQPGNGQGSVQPASPVSPQASAAVPIRVVPVSSDAMPAIETVNDSEIFSHGSPPQPKPEAAQAPVNEPAPAPGAPAGPEPGPGDEIPPLNDPEAGRPEPEPKTPDKTIDPNFLAQLVWGMELNLLGAIFGREMMPRKYVNPETGPVDMKAGELPYDESEMVRSAWVDYLASLGVIVLSPLKALYVAHAVYLIPRMMIVVQGVRGWFRKKTPPKPSASSEAKEEPQKPEPESRPKEPGTGEPRTSAQSEPMPTVEPQVGETILESMR